MVCRAWVAFILRRLTQQRTTGHTGGKTETRGWTGHIVASRVFGSRSDTLSSRADPAYQIFVSNEKSENVTVINGSDFSVTATIPVGKRPRGIHSSPDGKTVYVALSGTPVKAPPQIDAKGNPVFSKGKSKDDDDDDGDTADKAADGIGVIDVAARKLTTKLNAGSDPEEFALSRDGKRIYISNEDVKTASVHQYCHRQGRTHHSGRARNPREWRPRPTASSSTSLVKRAATFS
jgi:YVTN family beta-propeller protein